MKKSSAGMFDICVIGQGYIGLPTATLFAAHGKRVLGYDINKKAVATINQGKIHIEEPELETLVARVVKQGLLRADTTPHIANAYVITVPTPVDHRTHTPDLSYVFAATHTIAPLLKKGDLVVLESTSPVGTTEEMTKRLKKLRADLKIGTDILIAYCPERVLPGRIMHELIHNDRIIGGINEASTQAAVKLYRTLVKGALLETSAATAELVKLTENSYRDVNIAFANELSLVCHHLKLNVWEVIRLANHHPRVNILQPGAGVGGHCIAVDPWFIVHSAPKVTPLIATARHVNDDKRDFVVREVMKAAKRYKAPRIVCLGLAFKPDVDDLRESPAMYIAQQLAKKKAGKITVVEPHIASAPATLKSVAFAKQLSPKLLREADIVVALVKHLAFQTLNAKALRADATLVDACGLLA